MTEIGTGGFILGNARLEKVTLSRDTNKPPSQFLTFPRRLSGVVSAVAPLLALGVDVKPSSHLRLHGGPNTQADLNVAELHGLYHKKS